MSERTKRRFNPFAFILHLSDSNVGTIEEDYKDLTETPNETKGLEAGEDAANKTAELTVEDTSRTFGPDIEESADEIKEGNKIKTGKKASGGKGKGYNELPDKLGEQGITGVEPKPQENVEPVQKREKGGQTRDRFRK